MTGTREPQASVLGQILLMQSTVHALVGESQLAEFVCAGLKRIPGIGGAGFCLAGQLIAGSSESAHDNFPCHQCRPDPGDSVRGANGVSNCQALPNEKLGIVELRTSFGRYGFLLLEIDDAESYRLYTPYIESLSNVISLIIETSRQAAEIEVSKTKLETLVEARTAELADVNEQLREREHFISGIIATAPTLIYIYDLVERQNVFSNDRIMVILGFTPQELLDLGEQVFAALLHPDDVEKVGAHQQRLTGLADGEIAEVEYRMRHADGNYRMIHSWESIFARNAGGEPTQTAGVALDVTDQRESEAGRVALEEQFLASQRMEAVGRLAGGVAHDFNNLLTVIISYAEFGVDELRDGDPLRSNFEQILLAGERAAGLTRQLLAFSRKQVMKPEILNLNDIVSHMETMLQRLIGEDVALVVDLAEDLGNVKADVGQLEQVIMNLAVNARDAMPGGGCLTLRTMNVTLNEMYVNADVDRRHNAYAMLTATDNGGGMDETTRQRVFEPFFTTKEAGRGTGLGLSTVYGIIKQSGGDIWVHSAPGKGTTFEVYLPRFDQAEKEAIFRPNGERARPHSGVETVLVVEDEEAIRTLAHRILTSEGYTVLLASSGGDALLLSENYEQEVHLLVTDVIMPGINGRQLADRLIATRPNMKVLYMSGYTADVIMQHGVLDEGVSFIAKPFLSSALKATVRDVLKADGVAT